MLKVILDFKGLTVISSLVLSVALCACERESRPLGAKNPEQASVIGYTELASVSKVPAKSAGVSDVLPGGAGGGAIDGKSLFMANCSACHQATGLGLPGVFPPLAKSPYVESPNKERMAAIMIYGLMGPISVLGTTYTSMMAPLGTLSNEELAAIATYVRSSFGNTADAIDAGVFKATRDKFGSRGPFNINELGAEQ